MTRKIRTFQEYDAARRERELNLPQMIESRLEQMILINLRKSERRLGGVEIIAHPVDFLKALLQGPKEMMRLHLERQIEIHTPKAEQEATLEYFQQNIHELIGCSVSLSKPRGWLDDEQKQSFYVRFLDNVKELTDSEHFEPFKIRYSETASLLHGFRLPEREEKGFQVVVSVTEGLCREKYITRENADTIIRLLSSEKKEETFPARSLPGRGRTPAPVSEQTPIRNQDRSTQKERMEYLTMVLRLSPETAQEYADKVTLPQLREFHQGMDDAVGDEYASRLIQANPGLVLYPSENLLTKYLTTLQVVQRRIRSNGDTEKLEREFGIESNVDKYSSLEQLLQLKRQLFLETGNYHPATPEEVQRVDFQVYVSRYALLQRIPIMVQRLDSLIKDGELTVGKHEHWSERSGKEGGARGRKILKNIRTELNHLFTDLGYDSPGCEINFDRHILSVPERTQQLLGGIRDQAYQLQKK